MWGTKFLKRIFCQFYVVTNVAVTLRSDLRLSGLHPSSLLREKHKWICLLGYNFVLSGESQPTFRQNISPPSLRAKNKPSKKPASGTSFQPGLLLGLFFDPEDGGDMFLGNFG
jgi:hypothetical protein